MIDEMYDELRVAMQKAGWETMDIGYFEYNRNSKPNNHGKMTMPESWLVLYPDLLSYEEDGENQQKIWFKSGDNEMTNESKEKLFDILRPFKDEDYRGKNFWVSPEYPDGYWNNHSLGSD